jgi:hypothetical protein
MLSPGNDGNNPEIDISNPWIVIPYFLGDSGQSRPLNTLFPPIVTWLCPSISVEGVNYTTVPGSYLPDEPLAITVNVDNRGVPTALVTVDVYWADPSTGFVKPTLIASKLFPVVGRSVKGPTKSPKIIWTPDRIKIPAHFCLLVHATASPLEPFPGSSIPDPVGDRHWAQYNLQAATSVATSLTSVFWAGNPELESAAFTITAHPVSEESLKTIAQIVKAEPVAIKDEQIALHRVNKDQSLQELKQTSVTLELGQGERQPLVVSAQSLELSPHQFTAVEVIQTRIDGERNNFITGSLGIVVFAQQDSVRVLKT